MKRSESRVGRHQNIPWTKCSHILCMSAGDRAHTHSHAHSGSYLKKPKYANVSVCFHTYLIYWLGIVLRSGGIHAHTHTVCLVLCFWIGHVKIKRFWHINSVSGMWCGVCVCASVTGRKVYRKHITTLVVWVVFFPSLIRFGIQIGALWSFKESYIYVTTKTYLECAHT